MSDNKDIKNIIIKVEEEDNSKRLDKFLSEKLDFISRSRIKKIFDEGNISIKEKENLSLSYKVKTKDSVTIIIPPAKDAIPKANNIPLNIVYEDSDLIIIDKPANFVMHPAPGNEDNTLVNALLHHCKDGLSGIGGVKRPGIVHRIDKDTSGLVVVAKNDFTHTNLCEQFANHSVKRAYKALVWGYVKEKQGTIIGNIGRNPRDRKKMALVTKGGKHAITHYKTIKNYSMAATLLECRLETGRTHQIRVHLTNKGHPLIGDMVYGGAQKRCKSMLKEEANIYVNNFKRQALHAFELGFTHPKTKKDVFYTSNLPNDFKELINLLE